MKRGIVVLLVMFVIVMTPSGRAFAQMYSWEALYLSDSGQADGQSKLFKIQLDSISAQANLSLLPSGVVPFENVLALAATPDGERLYAIDELGPGSGWLGYYEVPTALWYEIGLVADAGGAIDGIVLASFSPDGMLYVASSTTDTLYTVDLTTATATLVGVVVNQATDAIVDLAGSDIAFAADGTLYLWTNRAKTGAPKGLYIVELPAVSGTVYATHLGEGSIAPAVRGLAIRDNGVGELLASTAANDQVVSVDKNDGSTLETFAMYLEGSPFDHRSGDMTAGPIMFCTRTIGYWKNHSWGGATVTICDVVVDETLGKQILWNARMKDFSMFFAQLIAAKLNCGDCVGIPVIDDAEEWLCQQPDIVEGDMLLWNKSYDSRPQKRSAAIYGYDLDNFNNEFHCE